MFLFTILIVVTAGLFLHSLCILKYCIFLLYIVDIHCILFISITACHFSLEFLFYLADFNLFLYLVAFSVYLYWVFVFKVSLY